MSESVFRFQERNAYISFFLHFRKEISILASCFLCILWKLYRFYGFNAFASLLWVSEALYRSQRRDAFALFFRVFQERYIDFRVARPLRRFLYISGPVFWFLYYISCTFQERKDCYRVDLPSLELTKATLRRQALGVDIPVRIGVILNKIEQFYWVANTWNSKYTRWQALEIWTPKLSVWGSNTWQALQNTRHWAILRCLRFNHLWIKQPWRWTKPETNPRIEFETQTQTEFHSGMNLETNLKWVQNEICSEITSR